MTWLVFAVSAVLTLAGAASIVAGAPIIQVERGWAEVIAGAVAVSGGVVTFAIAAVLVRLRAIQHALGRLDRAAPASEPAAPEALELRRTIAEPVAEPTLAAQEEDPPIEPEPILAAPDVRHGLWKRIRDLDEDSAPAGDDQRSAARTFAPADLVPVIPVAFPDPPIAAPPVALHDDTHGAERTATSPRDDSAASEAAGSIDWLDHGLLGRRPPRPQVLGEDPQTPADTIGSAEPSDASVSTAPDSDHSGLNQGQSEAHDPAATQPAPDEVTVIGRYQAGVASYVMYSDGTIEVETEGGDLRRFGSMDELKAFIARQETPVM